MDVAIQNNNLDLFYKTKIEALQSLSNIFGFNKKEPNLNDMKLIEFHIKCMYIRNMPFIFYAANSCILDILFKDWRKIVDETVLGKVVNRSSVEVRDWRNKVLTRDNNECVDCGSIKNLHAHHILHWSSNPEFRLNVNNGITLCGDCHSKAHPELAKDFVS